MQRQRLDVDSLLHVFSKNGNYSRDDRLLIQLIAIFIPGVVQTPDCLAKKAVPPDASFGERLHDVMCNFSYAYSPLPTLHGVEKNELIRRQIGENSVYGRVYQSVFEGNPIVTKAPIAWDTENIIEIFINVCVINRFLLNNISIHTLVPTYGLFVCPTNIPNGEELPKNKALQICVGDVPNKTPTMFMVQKFINGRTLAYYLNQNMITLGELLRYIHDICVALAMMEDSPYHIAHNDLHANNIMIADRNGGSEGHAVIIDWGKASFTIGPKRYQPYYYDEYLQKPGFHTGAYDVFELMKNIFLYTEKKQDKNSKEINAFIRHKMVLFYEMFAFNENPILNMFMSNDWLFVILVKAESYIQRVYGQARLNQQRLKNRTALKKMTYRYLAITLGFIGQHDIATLDAIPHRDVFRPIAIHQSPPRKPVTPPRKPVTPPRKPVTPPRKPVTPPRKPVTPPRAPPPRKPVTPPRAPPPRKPVTPPRSPKSKKCRCKTKTGDRCKLTITEGTRFCYRHQQCANPIQQKQKQNAPPPPPPPRSVTPPRAPPPRPATPPRSPKSKQCRCKTKTGDRCKLNITEGTRFCHRHQQCANPIQQKQNASPPRPATPPPRPATPPPRPATPPRAPPKACTCTAILKTGAKKGQECGRPCVHGNKCGIHNK